MEASWPIHRTIVPTSSPSSRPAPKSPKNRGMIISVLLTMPRVTDCDSASGLPMASTGSPLRSMAELPKWPAGKGARDALRPAGDVVVGHDVPVGADDRAAPGNLVLHFAAAKLIGGHGEDAHEAGVDGGDGVVD